MALFKRNRTWWTDFSLNGMRYRMSLDTTDWREAQAREKEKITQASQGKLAPSSQQFGRLEFGEAARRYLDSRRLELAPGSVKKEMWLLREPADYFRGVLLCRITAEDLRAYREKRAAEGKAAVYINMEVGAIRRLLKRAKRWYLLADDIRPLREQYREGRVLSLGEKLRLVRLASSRSEWQTARLAILLALNTTMRGCELRGLRWRDVDLIERTLVIRRSKTAAGERVIPLDRDAWTAILELRKKINALCGELRPEGYVFPACENGNIDSLRPQTSWRTAWRNLTRAVECPACGLVQQPADSCRNQQCEANLRGVESTLRGLRFHDLRHHSITELAESQASDQTIMAIAGHVSPRMLAHYSHVRLEAKRKALEALTRVGSRVGYGTKYVTKRPAEPKAIPQVIGQDGRPVRARTADLYRVKVAL
jgi:integrase